MSTVQEKVDADENDLQKLVNYLQRFILKRGWRLKIAKKTQVEQSLFIHAINEMGAIQNYLQVYPHPYNMSELKKIYVASILHDCEKETTEWQEKVRLGEKPPHHTNPEYAKTFINELINFLGENEIALDLSQDDVNDIISSQPLHMTGASKNPHIVFEELSRKHKSERWSEIANLIDLFDDIVSIESVESSIALLDKDDYRMLNERLEFTYHKISNVRGILTSLLHKACEKAYEKNGFTPYLYYLDGTLYFKVRRDEPDEKNSVDEIKIKNSLKTVINEFIRNIDNDNKVVIENPQTKLFRGRDFFDKELIDKYFFKLQRKYRPKVDKDGLKKLIISNFNSLENAKEQLNIQEIKDSEIIDSIFQNINIYSVKFPKFSNEFIETYSIGISKLQQYFFQIFKEIIEELEINKTVIAEIEKEYDSFFGIDPLTY